MIVYFKIKRALRNIERSVRSRNFDCKAEDVNSCVFDASKMYLCLKVATDFQKELLLSDSELMLQCEDAFLREGIYMPHGSEGFRIESQETVDRDWNGNWFYALFK